VSYVIHLEWLEGTTSPFSENVDGSYVKTYDPDAFNGQGDMTATHDSKEAKRFPDAKAAMEFYRQVSTVRPVRGDGKPNRPLTAFTVSFKSVAD
jgi:hypothetical protein